MVVLLYSDISNLTFWSVNIFKRKNFLIGFLDELGNFKQKKITFFKMQIFFTIYSKRLIYFSTTSYKKRYSRSLLFNTVLP